MTPEFMERFDKVYPIIMSEGFMEKVNEVALRKNTVQLCPPSRHARDEGEDKAPVRTYTMITFKLDTGGLKIRDEAYIG